MHNLLLIGTRLGLGGGTVGHRGELSGFDLIFMSWVNRLCLFCLFFLPLSLCAMLLLSLPFSWPLC
jgi:hypothetical protein